MPQQLKWWVRQPKDAAPVKVKPPASETQPESVDTPKASKAKAEVKVKDG